MGPWESARRTLQSRWTLRVQWTDVTRSKLSESYAASLGPRILRSSTLTPNPSPGGRGEQDCAGKAAFNKITKCVSHSDFEN